MKRFPLSKKNKLCSVIAIDALFARGKDVESALRYPGRVVWRVNESRKADPDTPKFFISVPKRKLRNAVDRVKMRRRIREAYRLLRPEVFNDVECSLDFGIVYVADCLLPYSTVEASMKRLLIKIKEKCCASSQDGSVNC